MKKFLVLSLFLGLSFFGAESSRRKKVKDVIFQSCNEWFRENCLDSNIKRNSPFVSQFAIMLKSEAKHKSPELIKGAVISFLETNKHKMGFVKKKKKKRKKKKKKKMTEKSSSIIMPKELENAPLPSLPPVKALPPIPSDDNEPSRGRRREMVRRRLNRVPTRLETDEVFLAGGKDSDLGKMVFEQEEIERKKAEKEEIMREDLMLFGEDDELWSSDLEEVSGAEDNDDEELTDEKAQAMFANEYIWGNGSDDSDDDE